MDYLTYCEASTAHDGISKDEVIDQENDILEIDPDEIDYGYDDEF